MQGTQRNRKKQGSRTFAARLCLALALTTASLAAPARAQMQSVPADDSLAVYVNGELFGSVLLSFERAGEDLVARSRLLVEQVENKQVVYKRREIREEVWRDGDIVEFRNDIEENGQTWQVSAVRIGPRLAITTDDGTRFAPPGCLPATFWSIETIKRQSVFDPATGEVHRVDTVPLSPVELEDASGKIKARQFLMTGDINRNLYYAESGRWLGLRYLSSDARMVEFRPQ